MNTELPPSILVDDHGTIKDAFLVAVRDGVTTYRVRTLQEQREWITELLKPEPPARLEADTARAMDLINKAFGS